MTSAKLSISPHKSYFGRLHCRFPRLGAVICPDYNLLRFCELLATRRRPRAGCPEGADLLCLYPASGRRPSSVRAPLRSAELPHPARTLCPSPSSSRGAIAHLCPALQASGQLPGQATLAPVLPGDGGHHGQASPRLGGGQGRSGTWVSVCSQAPLRLLRAQLLGD